MLEKTYGRLSESLRNAFEMYLENVEKAQKIHKYSDRSRTLSLNKLQKNVNLIWSVQSPS